MQVPPAHLSPVVHALPSLHAFWLSMVNLQPTALSQESSVQGLVSSHANVPEPTHTPPALQVSTGVQYRPSLHPVPAATATFLQPPTASQVSLVHGLASSQPCPAPEHTPLWHLSPVVQSLPSLHAVLSATAAWEHPLTPQVSDVHGFWSLQLRVPAPTQVPLPLQVSTVVQMLLSLQGWPLVMLVKVHPPCGLHVSVVHTRLSLHTRPTPEQTPDAQASFWVQALPSLQPVPSPAEVKTQPVALLQVSTVHGLLSLHWRVPLPTQVPVALHASVGVHKAPSLQAVPTSAAEPRLSHVPLVTLQLSTVHGLLSLQSFWVPVHAPL